MSRPGLRAATPIFCFLLFSYAFYNITGFLPESVSPEAISRHLKRQAKNYVIFTTNYYTVELGDLSGQIVVDVTFGSDNQVLRLGLSSADFTWVPKEPTSPAAFCNDPQNAEACMLVGRSGYYQTDAKSKERFTSDVANFTGFVLEDTVTVGGERANLQFGVAEGWVSSPVLGLGLGFPSDGSDPIVNKSESRPSYLETLTQQGRIASQVSSFHNIFNDTHPGEVILGGVDRSKYYGTLETCDWDRSVSTLPTLNSPEIRVGDTTVNSTSFTGPYLIPSGRLATVHPFSIGLILPPIVFNASANALRPFGADTIPSDADPSIPQGGYIACDARIPRHLGLQFRFKTITINIPFDDLILRTAPIEDTGLCVLAMFPPGPEDEEDLILGGAFINYAYLAIDVTNNVTAIAPSNRNSTTRDIVAIGGSFGATLANTPGNLLGPAEDLKNSTTTIPESGGNSSLPVGAWVGIGVGAFLVLVGAITLGVFLYRRKNARKLSAKITEKSPKESDPMMTLDDPGSLQGRGYELENTPTSTTVASPLPRRMDPTMETHSETPHELSGGNWPGIQPYELA